MTTSAHERPNSPAIPRPDNRPYYVAPECPDCGTPLVLGDYLNDPRTPGNIVSIMPRL